MKLNKQESEKYIKEFFNNLEHKKPEDIKKMLKIAMSRNIKLGEKKKLFCKKCHTVFKPSNIKIRIKNKFKITRCLSCGFISSWKLHSQNPA